MDTANLQLLIDRIEISDVIIQLASALDKKDWTLFRSYFTDEIEADYSDLRKESPATIKADDFVALRRTALINLKTQHLSTNHIVRIEVDEATCTSHFTIYRFLPESAPSHGWLRGIIGRISLAFSVILRGANSINIRANNYFDTHGYYTHKLVRTADGWKIKGIKQTVFWSKGNPRIHAGVSKDTI